MTQFLGLDIGTTSTIGILIDDRGNTLATASRPSRLISDHAGWAEEEPEQWWNNSCELIAELLQVTGSPPQAIAGIGVTGMLPALVLLDKSGRPLRRSIQQNDARASAEIAELQQEVEADEFFTRTGGSINQQSIAPTLRWLQRHEPDVFGKIDTIVGSYEYLSYRLTGARYLEHNWALESGLMDVNGKRFTPELLKLAGIAAELLPPIHTSQDIIGQVSTEAAAATGLAAGTPVVAGCADHVVSAYVAGAVSDGDLVLKFGGAGDILLSTATAVTDPRLFIDYHIVPGLYFSNGCMAASGSVLNWIVKQFCNAEQTAAEAAGESVYVYLDRLAADVPAGAEGVILLPYFLGEKTPLHDPHARGTLVGLGLHHQLAHIWRAALEGVVFGFRHHVDVFEQRGVEVKRVVACDGGAASDLWLQIAADVIQRPVQRLLRHPGSCLGAAFVAGIGVGAFDDWDKISQYVEPGEVFRPDHANAAVYDQAYVNYREIYQRLKTLYPRL